MLRFRARNAAIRRIRARVEKIIGTWKRSSGLAGCIVFKIEK
jgi:hypothetical protein